MQYFAVDGRQNDAWNLYLLVFCKVEGLFTFTQTDSAWANAYQKSIDMTCLIGYIYWKLHVPKKCNIISSHKNRRNWHKRWENGMVSMRLIIIVKLKTKKNLFLRSDININCFRDSNFIFNRKSVYNFVK